MTTAEHKAAFIKRTAWIMAGLFWLAMFVWLTIDWLGAGYRPGVAVLFSRKSWIIFVFCVLPLVCVFTGGAVGAVTGWVIDLFWKPLKQRTL